MNPMSNLSVDQITLLTGLPYLAVVPTIYVAGSGADYLRRKNILSTTAVRKLGDFVCAFFFVHDFANLT